MPCDVMQRGIQSTKKTSVYVGIAFYSIHRDYRIGGMVIVFTVRFDLDNNRLFYFRNN